MLLLMYVSIETPNQNCCGNNETNRGLMGYFEADHVRYRKINHKVLFRLLCLLFTKMVYSSH